VADALMIEAHGLTKRYGSTLALAGLDLEVLRGHRWVLGRTRGQDHRVRILTTLSLPDGGSAGCGYDVVKEAAVQRNRGNCEDATLDEVLTGRQNLVMIGRLSGLRRADARAVASDLLDR